MRKRLRKKRHLGEYRQLGFSLQCKFGSVLSPEAFDQFTDAFLAEAVERHGLIFGGGGSPSSGWHGLLCRNHRYASTDETDRTAVSTWLAARPEVDAFLVSVPWDVWHGMDPLEEPAVPVP